MPDTPTLCPCKVEAELQMLRLDSYEGEAPRILCQCFELNLSYHQKQGTWCPAGQNNATNYILRAVKIYVKHNEAAFRNLSAAAYNRRMKPAFAYISWFRTGLNSDGTAKRPTGLTDDSGTGVESWWSQVARIARDHHGIPAEPPPGIALQFKNFLKDIKKPAPPTGEKVDEFFTKIADAIDASAANAADHDETRRQVVAVEQRLDGRVSALEQRFEKVAADMQAGVQQTVAGAQRFASDAVAVVSTGATSLARRLSGSTARSGGSPSAGSGRAVGNNEIEVHEEPVAPPTESSHQQSSRPKGASVTAFSVVRLRLFGASASGGGRAVGKDKMVSIHDDGEDGFGELEHPAPPSAPHPSRSRSVLGNLANGLSGGRRRPPKTPTTSARLGNMMGSLPTPPEAPASNRIDVSIEPTEQEEQHVERPEPAPTAAFDAFTQPREEARALSEPLPPEPPEPPPTTTSNRVDDVRIAPLPQLAAHVQDAMNKLVPDTGGINLRFSDFVNAPGRILNFVVEVSSMIGEGAYATVYIAAAFPKDSHTEIFDLSFIEPLALTSNDQAFVDPSFLELSRDKRDRRTSTLRGLFSGPRIAIAKNFGQVSFDNFDFEKELKMAHEITFGATKMPEYKKFVTQLIDVNTDLQMIFYEYGPYGDLWAMMTENQKERGGPLPKLVIQMIMTQVASGTLFLHGNEVVHRDIKPSNVVLTAPYNHIVSIVKKMYDELQLLSATSDDIDINAIKQKLLAHTVVRLVDYGVAKQHKIGREECDDSAGTEWYMPPESFLYEMVDGEKKVIPFNGFLSDVWALGIIYFQLVAVNINGLSLHPLLTPAEQKTVNQDTNDRFSIAERMETLALNDTMQIFYTKAYQHAGILKLPFEEKEILKSMLKISPKSRPPLELLLNKILEWMPSADDMDTVTSPITAWATQSDGNVHAGGDDDGGDDDGGSGSGSDGIEELLKHDAMRGVDPELAKQILTTMLESPEGVSWDSIAGLQYAKQSVGQITILPAMYPEIFVGERAPPKGLLLFGPPGTGKTLIAKAIASEGKSTFFSISASSLMSKWIGEGEKMVKTLFAIAHAKQPSVIFVDEVDSMLSLRQDGESESMTRFKTEFLVQMNGANYPATDRVLVIGATNRPWALDEAVRRRFTKKLLIPLPNSVARLQIIQKSLQSLSEPHQLSEAEIASVVADTEGYSGSDMNDLCKEAANGPVIEDYEKLLKSWRRRESYKPRPVNITDYQAALLSARRTVSAETVDECNEWNAEFGDFKPPQAGSSADHTPASPFESVFGTPKKRREQEADDIAEEAAAEAEADKAIDIADGEEAASDKAEED